MTEEQKSTLIAKYEKIKDKPSDWFDRDDWQEFNSFCQGYMMAYEDLNKEVEYIKKEYENLNELLDKVANFFQVEKEYEDLNKLFTKVANSF